MTISLPTSWKDVTVGEWQAIRALIKESEGKEKTPENDYLLQCAIISTLSGEDMDDILQQSRGSHGLLMETLSFLTQPIEGNVRQFQRVGKKRYYFEKYAENITGGQYIDLMHFLKDPDKIDENLHKLVACVTVPVKWWFVKGKYDGKKFFEIAEDVKQMPITTVKPLTDFFLQHYLNCAKVTVHYLEREAEKLKRQAERELKRSSADGVGSTQSTTSLTGDGSYGSTTRT